MDAVSVKPTPQQVPPTREPLDAAMIRALLRAGRQTTEAFLRLDEAGRERLKQLAAQMESLALMRAALERRERGCSKEHREARQRKYEQSAQRLRERMAKRLEQVQELGFGNWNPRETAKIIEEYEEDFRALTLVSPSALELLDEELAGLERAAQDVLLGERVT